MYAILRTKNEGLKSEVVDFAQQLIQTPSPSLEEGKAADLVEQRMNDLGYDKVMRDEVGNVLGLIIGREGNPTVLLNSHMDTILPGESERDQAYSGRIDGNLMYGLGAADCKAGLAAQIYAGALLRRSLLPFRGNLAVAATVAEENGRSIGVRALMEHTLPDLELEPGFAVLAEPTGLGLYYGHDGWVDMQIRVEGANPFQVDDAARAILNDLNAKVKSGDVVSDIEAMEIGDAHFEDVNGSRCATIEMTRRLGAAESVEEVLDQTKQVASLLAQPAGSVAVEVMTATESQKLYNGQTAAVRHVAGAWCTDPFDPMLGRARQALAAAGCSVNPGKWELARLGMGTAGSVLLNDFGVPTVGYGPGLEIAAHSNKEYVELDKVTECVYGTAAIVHSIVGTPVFGWTSNDI